MCIKFIVNPIKSDALVYNLNRTDYQSIGNALIATSNTKFRSNREQTNEMENKCEFKMK